MIAPQSKKKQIKAAETRRCGRIGASECLERDRGPGGHQANGGSAFAERIKRRSRGALLPGTAQAGE